MNIDQNISDPAERSKLDPARKAKLVKAVREFESVFVGYMLKSMRNTIQKADNSTDSFGADMLEGMFDVEFAKHISKNSNLGLADMLYRKMTGEQLVKTPAAPSSKGSDAIRVSEKSVNVERANLQKIEPTVVQPAVKAERIVAQLPRVELSNEKPTIANLVSARAEDAAKDAVRVAKVSELKVDRKPAKHLTMQERVKKYNEFIAEASEKHGVNENLIKAVIAAESGGRANAVSTQNAKGVMQLIDSTATAMGVRNVWDPRQNILGGVKYLAQLLDRFDGDEKLAVASYNAGPGNIIKHGGIPPFKETKQYVTRVMNLLQLFSQQENSDE